jgi:hypothetical protein
MRNKRKRNDGDGIVWKEEKRLSRISTVAVNIVRESIF